MKILGSVGGEFLVWSISWTQSWNVPNARRLKGVTRGVQGWVCQCPMAEVNYTTTPETPELSEGQQEPPVPPAWVLRKAEGSGCVAGG